MLSWGAQMPRAARSVGGGHIALAFALPLAAGITGAAAIVLALQQPAEHDVLPVSEVHASDARLYVYGQRPADVYMPAQEPEDVLPPVPDGLTDLQQQVWLRLWHHGREYEYDCLAEIIVAESSWRPNVVGDVDIGGSYGLVQRHAPAHGKPELPWPVDDQIDWALQYADERYGGVCEGAEARREQGWW